MPATANKSLFRKILPFLGRKPPQAPKYRVIIPSPPVARKRPAFMRARAYDAGKTDRITEDWTVPTYTSGDSEHRNALLKVRERAREGARNNPWIKKERILFENNVVGSAGIRLRSLATTRRGAPDKKLRDAIEWAWFDFQKKVTIDGRHSLNSLLCAAVTSRRIDGEILIRKVKAFRGNKWRYGLQLLEADYLDFYLNQRSPAGREIRMGVELGEHGEPVNYWLLRANPADYEWNTESLMRTHVPVPANEIIHFYRPDRPNDTRGISELAQSLYRLKMLTEYEVAELVAAREQANKGVYLQTKTPDNWTGLPTLDEDGNPIDYSPEVISQPGTAVMLPPGVEANIYNPTHPNANMPAFEKAQLRAVSAAGGLSYHSLAGDLEAVNLSSGRLGLLEDRETYKREQRLCDEKILSEIFPEWLSLALMGNIPGYSMADYDRALMHEWRPRVWPYMDPYKEAQANETALKNRIKSPQEVIGETTDRDAEEVLKDWADWEAMGGPTMQEPDPALDASGNGDEPDPENGDSEAPGSSGAE